MGELKFSIVLSLYVLFFFHRENRYLLFLTENYAALQTLQHFLETSDPGAKDDEHHSSPFVLFGSSFPKDKDYTQVMSLHGHNEFLFMGCN